MIDFYSDVNEDFYDYVNADLNNDLKGRRTCW